MPEDTTATAEEPTAEAEAKHENTVPFERFQKVNQQAKEAKQQAAQLAKDIADLRAQMEDRETAGLPELERERKRAEQLEKRAAAAEQKAAESDGRLAMITKRSWITAAALAQGFLDPSDASAFVDLTEVDDEKDAERAVRDLAKRKKHLLKGDEPTTPPGRVLQNGRPTPSSNPGLEQATAEAEMLSNGLKQFLKNRQNA